MLIKKKVGKSNDYIISLRKITVSVSTLIPYLTLSTVNEPSFIPRARWIPSTFTAAQRIGSSILHLAINA